MPLAPTRLRLDRLTSTGTKSKPATESATPEAQGQGQLAVASLLITHASFSVSATLETCLTDALRPYKGEVDVVIGLPTLGLGVAVRVAGGLGFGYSRKFWYEDALSTVISSITSPGEGKRVFLDPNLLELVRGRRVLVVDDAVSSGMSFSSFFMNLG
ncbi:hypothetical protein LOCC1_G007887 [Lachnellula occidentalis]|uniref:Phosphoribosyltransferase domain-containing protein n=1 Tax=Lachnellula occidentalis TaxID=215460 RepID=A0A8H8RH08_9HELO|nr:hypothetical protein LOCC1_G007887 [Lachnellula occidentalis]